jgi:ABC-2 type transport system permease protein
MALLWYGLWSVGAALLAILLAETDELDRLSLLLPRGLMAAFLYWQLIPVLLVSAGASLELKRLLVYPIPTRQLFGLEVVLRLSSGVEMMLVLAGATIGLWANPALPLWAPAGFVPFALMNLFLSAGIRNLQGRLLARKYIREASVLLIVLAAGLPQLALLSGVPAPLRELMASPPNPLLPWSAASRVALGEAAVTPWAILLFWTAAAWAFGRWQFERGLHFDSDEAGATRTRDVRGERWSEKLYRLPSVLCPDPLGVIVEKEIRFLSRAPRFRLVFLMGFSFGLLVWLPIALRGSGGAESAFASNYLTFVSVYALLLLGEVAIWNSFGFDRGAAQLYFQLPVPVSKVLAGKNIAAAVFVFLEVSAVASVCFLMRMPVSAAKLAESYAVTAVLALYMLAAGNLGSAHYPRPVDPRKSWRSVSAGRFQAMLLFIYPVLAIPVVLAFVVRYAFDSNTAFYAALALAASLGAVLYRMALRSSVTAVLRRQEKLLSTLAESEGPVSV